MPNKLYLSLIFHNHQPVGNFGQVFEEAYTRAYDPLLSLYERHPQVKGSFHFTGPLRDWLLTNRPDYFPRLRTLVERGQIEMLGGAYYEPILVMLDDADKIGQMRKMSESIQHDFGQQTNGMWLAERIWEPHLAKPIAQAGLRYAVVDDTHFNYAGFEDHELLGYYLTEESGHRLALLPTSRHLRYTIPAHDVDTVMRDLRALVDDPRLPDSPLLAMGEDGEKFGMWLGSYSRCWEQGWMDAFFDALAANQDWIETTTPTTYMDQHPALGRAYLPVASYMEMSAWAMPASRAAEFDAVRQFVHDAAHAEGVDAHTRHMMQATERYLRGGTWRSFLVKYPEANHMQKRATHIANLARSTANAPAAVFDHIWAAQCNCAYWHGLFGGIYLYHIRAANYAHLLAALDALLDDKVHVETYDFDLDGQDEIIVHARPTSIIVAPNLGGAILEWDDLPSQFNLLNIISRREEAYHETLRQAAQADRVITPESHLWNTPADGYTRAKEHGLDDHLIVDQHRRGLLIDHFLAEDATVNAMYRAQADELGDFVEKAYTAQIDQSTSQGHIQLERDGTVSGQAIRIKKTITLASGERGIKASYTITNMGDAHVALRYALEACIGFDGGDSHFCGVAIDEETGSLGEVRAHETVDNYRLWTGIRGFSLQVNMSRTFDLWRFPLTPVTMSDGGFERVHQGAVLLHVFDLTLAAGDSWSLDASWTLADLPG